MYRASQPQNTFLGRLEAARADNSDDFQERPPPRRTAQPEGSRPRKTVQPEGIQKRAKKKGPTFTVYRDFPSTPRRVVEQGEHFIEYYFFSLLPLTHAPLALKSSKPLPHRVVLPRLLTC